MSIFLKFFEPTTISVWRNLFDRMIVGLLLFAIIFINELMAEEKPNPLTPENELMMAGGIMARSATYRLSATRPPDGKKIIQTKKYPVEGEKFDFTHIQKAEDGSFQVGIILPLSGEFSELGQDFLNAAILALFDVHDKKLTLLISDSKGTVEGAIAASKDVISRGADVILGPIFDYTISAVSPITRAVNIPLIGFSTNRHIVEDGVYLLNFSPEQQVDRIVEFASDQDIRRFAALIPEDNYGVLMEKSFREAVTKYGGEIVQIVYYSPQFDQLGAAARELSNSDIGGIGDAIFIPEGGNMLISLVSFLTYYDIDPKIVRLLGTGLWDDPLLRREPSLRLGWYSSPSRQIEKRFQNHFENHYGHYPPRVVELGYDALLIAAMLQKQEITSDEISTILARDGGFTGVNGIFRFLPNGLSERGLSIFEIRKDKMKEISPASNTFQ